MHWQLAINSTPVLIKKELPDSQSLQSIQVTDTFKQTNCFALPGYIQMNILPVTCSMHTSTRKLATPKQKNKNKTKQQQQQQQQSFYACFSHLCYMPQCMHKSRHNFIHIWVPQHPGNDCADIMSDKLASESPQFLR